MFVANFPKNGSILPMNNPRKISSSLLAFASTKINTHGAHGRMRAQVRFSPLKDVLCYWDNGDDHYSKRDQAHGQTQPQVAAPDIK